MEVRVVNNPGIDPRELNEDSYVEYCRLYLTERLYEVTPVTAIFNYGNISRIIKCINRDMYLNLNTETGKLLLLNKIYSLFMEGNQAYDREFLYKHMCHLANYNPKLYK